MPLTFMETILRGLIMKISETMYMHQQHLDDPPTLQNQISIQTKDIKTSSKKNIIVYQNVLQYGIERDLTYKHIPFDRTHFLLQPSVERC